MSDAVPATSVARAFVRNAVAVLRRQRDVLCNEPYLRARAPDSACIVAALLTFLAVTTPAAAQMLRVMTANTAVETGIIQALADDFHQRHPEVEVSIAAAGALQVLDNGRQGKADVIITHHPQAEVLFMTEGYGQRRAAFMYNEFAIIGPRADPLRLSGERDLMVVLRRLAKNQVPFMAPGARSGTSSRLNDLWTMAGIAPDWLGYETQNSSAAATLANAALFDAYTFADLGTYFMQRARLGAGFVPLYRDHVLLRNTYSAIVVNTDKVRGVNRAAAEAFLEYLVSDDGQTLIRQFSESRFGTLVYTPSAHLDEGLHAERARHELAAQQRTVAMLATLVVVLVLVCGMAVWLYWRVHRLERARRQSEERFKRAVSGSSDGIWDWDVQQDSSFVSPRLGEILGLEPGEAQNVRYGNLRQHVHADDRAQLDQVLAAYLVAAPTPDALELRFRIARPDGSSGWALLRGKAVRNADGRALQLSGSLTDITAHVQAEEASRLALAEKLSAQLASQAKSAFLANMSHEIRTPLTAIIGFAETLTDTRQTATERLVSVQSIAHNGRHLLQLINNILDVSKIESDKLEVERLPVSPLALVEEVRALLAPQAQAKGLALRIDYQFPLPASIDTDPVRIKQILLNLCSNAIKFTSAGGLHVRVACVREHERMQFEVRDSGIGLRHDQLARLFTAFSQADSSTTRRYGGTGLGLHLSRRLAELLGGDIAVTSEPNVGSCFTLMVSTGSLAERQFLNEAPLPAPAAISAAPQHLAGRVLLAEDNPDNQRLISMHVTQTGAEIVVAHNGLQAVELALREPFDIILMDMQMPVMDGLEATRVLRGNGYTGSIVALTANAFREDRDACLAAGCNDFITKPIARDVLLRALATCLAPGAAPAPNTDPIASALLEESPEFLDLVTTFVERLPQMIQELEDALPAPDWVGLKRFAHDLKGIGGSYGYLQVTTVAAKLEFEIIKQDLAAATARVGELRALADRIKRGLRRVEASSSPVAAVHGGAARVSRA
jgi:PAS domain S-box-containing protein